MNYLLDTTALVAHALREAGADEVQALIADEENDLFMSALSFFELAGVLKKQGATGKIPIYWETYGQIAEVVPADALPSQAAWNLRRKTGKRLPMADAIIVAATAQARNATLVHRNEHLAQIPEKIIPQIRLPSE